MDELMQESKVYRAKNRETDSRKCRANMTKRLPMLSSGNFTYEECVKQWTKIVGSSDLPEKLCLCGMKITDAYYFLNSTNGNICSVGVECCKRINSTAIKVYKESLKKKGTCYICETKHKDLDSHYKLKGHIAKKKKHFDDFKVRLNELLKERAKESYASEVATSEQIAAHSFPNETIKTAENKICLAFSGKKTGVYIEMNCKIKFLPIKFPKVVVTIAQKDINTIEKLRLLFYWQCEELYKFYDNSNISLKVNSEQREVLCKMQPKQRLNATIYFEGVYKYGAVWYPLITLKNFTIS